MRHLDGRRFELLTQIIVEQSMFDLINRLLRFLGDLFQALCWLCASSVHVYERCNRSRGAPIIVMQPVQHGEGNDLSLSCGALLSSSLFRNFLPDPLVRTRMIEIGYIFPSTSLRMYFEHAIQLLVAENQEMIQAFAARTG